MLFQGLNSGIVSEHLRALKEASLSSSILKETDIENMLKLQDAVLSNLPSHKKHFIAHRTREDFLKFIQSSGSVIGLKSDNELVAYSIIEFPKDVTYTDFDQKIQIDDINKTALLKSTLVHPDFRGLNLQKTLIDARIEQASQHHKTCIICEVDIKNAASIKNLMTKGFTIQDSGHSPVDFMPSVYMYKYLEVMPTLPNNNSLQLVPVEDWNKHKQLLSQGLIGVDYFDGFITYRTKV